MRHGRAGGHVLGAGSDPLGNNFSFLRQSAQIAGHTHINDKDPGPGQPGQGVDPGAALYKVVNHLGGHLARVFAHALGCDAVIRRHGDDGLPGHRRVKGTGHAGQLFGQIHDPAQCPVGHGEHLQSGPGAVTSLGILRADVL